MREDMSYLADSLTERDREIIDGLISALNGKVEENLATGKAKILGFHLGIDQDDGGLLLVCDTVAGRTFFELRLNGVEILLKTPRTKITISVEKLLEQLSS